MPDAAADRLASYIASVRKLAPLIHQHGDEAERNAQLSREVVEEFHRAGLFRIFLPARMGGGELTIPQSFRLVEEVAYVDGSAGWNMAICSGGPLFGHYVARDAFEEIFSNPRAVIAGSLNAMTTTATRGEGGWVYSGKATNASGSGHATHIMAAGLVMRDGAPQFTDGIPQMRAAVFPVEHVKILSTWSVSGMRATGSNDCTFENVFVPERYTFEFPNPRETWTVGAWAKLPQSVQTGGVFGAVALGIAHHALDAFKDLAMAKIPIGSRATLRERPMAQVQLAQAEGLVRAGRAYYYDCYDDMWRRAERGETFNDRALADARLAAVTAGRLAIQAVDLIYDAAGLSAIQTSCPIERCWRDVHATTQHILMAPGRYETVGRILLGLPPGFPLI